MSKRQNDTVEVAVLLIKFHPVLIWPVCVQCGPGFVHNELESVKIGGTEMKVTYSRTSMARTSLGP